MSELLKPTVEQQKMFYRPICSSKEIDRILSPDNARDELLRIRADHAVDNMRVFRFYLNVLKARGRRYKFSDVFNGEHYRTFLRRLPDSDQRKCSVVTYGDIICYKSNGLIFLSEFGPIITINYALRYFLKFFHLYAMKFDRKIPDHVRHNALRIAIRVMLQKETLDFLQDPRGIVPKDVAVSIHQPIRDQLSFIAAHEYAHFMLGHLYTGDAHASHSILGFSGDEEEHKYPKVFNPSQQKELDADVWALLKLTANNKDKSDIFSSIIFWFVATAILEQAEEQIFPSPGASIKSHPKAVDRISNLADNCKIFREIWKASEETSMEVITYAHSFLQDDIATNFEWYETYGSIYLDKPNSEWRGRELVDRKDYY